MGLLGDVHGDSIRLLAAIEFLREIGSLDLIACVGDIVNLDADTEQCCRLLQDARVATVRGNHDRWFLQNLPFYVPEDERSEKVGFQSRAYIASLPAVREIETIAGTALLCHGLGEDDMASIYPADDDSRLAQNIALWKLQAMGRYRYIVNGHTHSRMVREFAGLTVINAGAIFGPCAGFSIVDYVTSRIQFFDFREDHSAQVGEQVALT